MAAQDSDLFDWGMMRFIAALNDIDADGYLALELARGSKALHYHRFSLEPLLLLALIARANDVMIPPDGQKALERLIQRVRSGLDDPRLFAERTGRTQDVAGQTRNDWAWAELAGALFNDADLAARTAPLRPFLQRWLGGDLTLRYAKP
jgi:poly(beta-D-mannuronate) lyase